MSTPQFQVIFDEARGYRRLEPIPDRGLLNEFYHADYYRLLKEGKRAPQLARLSGGGALAERERHWLRSTLYTDLLALIVQNQTPGTSKTLLDVGCGTGEFMLFVQDAGWRSTGVELSPDAIALARERGLDVRQSEVEALAAAGGQKFGCVSMLHVLEHVPDPADMLQAANALLEPAGLLVIQVPNDFSQLQEEAQRKAQRSGWWIAIPDHVNYFDAESLQALLARCGFEVLQLSATFPMEFFLLMGDDYTSSPEVGKECHRRRVDFELALSPTVRQSLYQALAAAGMGRDVIAVARKSA